jgi:hypothetical protein
MSDDGFDVAPSIVRERGPPEARRDASGELGLACAPVSALGANPREADLLAMRVATRRRRAEHR